MALSRLRARRGTASQWSTVNPTPGLGELCFETDTLKLKIGDGTSNYNTLDYVVGDTGGGGGGSLPTGGSTNQALLKQSTTDGDADWETLTKTLVGLDQVDNTSDIDKPVSTDVEAALGTKADASHTHDERYPQLSQTNQFLVWRTGDADPWWVATSRPIGMVTFIVLGTGDTVPSWKTSDDFVFVGDASATVPTIRSFGGFTALTANASNIDCVYPADIQDGDTLWLCVGTTGSAPTTPSGWSVAESYLTSGASSTDGVIIYGRTLTAGQAASLAGTTQNVTLGTSTAALSTIVCWNGAISIDQAATHVDDANTATSQTFGAVTPTAPSTVVGVSGVRYDTLSGGTNVGPRTGWTELFDRSTAKAGAPQRGLVFSVLDTEGESGVATSAATGNTPGPAVRTAEYTISVVTA
jgi:hypothetical protein